jgi:hypothetical protein
MNNVLKPVIFICCFAVLVHACKKEDRQIILQEVSNETFRQIKKLGFNTDGLKKVEEGYLVEGDIFLSHEDLGFQPASPNMVIANEEQYRTFKIVNSLAYPSIKVNLHKNSSSYQRVFSAALKEAIKRFNALDLKLKFHHGNTSHAHINVTIYNAENNTLASAGFPTSNGAPYNSIRLNAYHFSTSTSPANIDYIATIITHELGHCSGFRHTDYMNRAYSCGGDYANEGQSTSGAVHIPGTPTGSNPGSWMLACIGSGTNRPFNFNDIKALNYVY